MPSNQLSLSLSEQLRSLRRQRKLTQEKAASLIGYDYKYYQSLESGSKDMRLSMLERISNAFGLKVTVLFEPIPEDKQGDS